MTPAQIKAEKELLARLDWEIANREHPAPPKTERTPAVARALHATRVAIAFKQKRIV
jgi:hypothetical protein